MTFGMQRIKKLFFLLMILSVIFPVIGKSQDSDWQEDLSREEFKTLKRYSFLSLDFDWNIPVGMQRNFVQRHTLGLGARYLLQVKPDKPLFAGASVFYGSYDQSSYEYYDFSEIGDFLFRETSYAAIFNVHVDLRYFPGLGFWIFEPFVGTSIGMSNSMLYSSIYNVDLDENHGMIVEENNWKPVYLFETGTLIQFDKELDEVFGHFTIGYISGNSNIFFLKKTDYNPTTKPVNHFDQKKIPYQMLKINFGIIAYF